MVIPASHSPTPAGRPREVAARREDPPLPGERRGGGRERPDGAGPVRAQPWATGLPPSPVSVMHQRLPRWLASRAARSRESPASSGPYPAAWPGASDRPSQVARGMVRFTAPSGPCPQVLRPGPGPSGAVVAGPDPLRLDPTEPDPKGPVATGPNPPGPSPPGPNSPGPSSPGPSSPGPSSPGPSSPG